MGAGEKLPALINASLTLVPGDGIYCFGNQPLPADHKERLTLPSQVALTATSTTVPHPLITNTL